MDSTDEKKFAYAAFISYRHLPRDKEVAKKVQRAIEGFKLPRGVDAAEDSEGRALGKCFRDEDELAASHSLPENIRSALASSRNLIVICSPDTADSLWVQREIEEFIKLHGREHVIPVLAEGASAESIPPILKQRETAEIGGRLTEVTANPLAADLRPGNAREHKAEILRILAAVAGCDYDNLKQRQRRRQRMRLAAAIAGAVVIAGIIAALVVWGLTPSEEQLTAESRDLAAQSTQQLAQGDRMGAIETALAALPSSSADNSRPLVPEAEAALEAAVQVNPDSQEIWRPSFVLETPGFVESFTSSASGSWAAVLDDTLMVSAFDLVTGASLSQVNLANYMTSSSSRQGDDPAGDWTMIAAGASKLVLANRTGEGSLLCIDVPSGDVVWEHENVTVSSIALSDDERQIVIFSIFEEDAFMAGLVDVETGEAVDWEEFDNPGFLEWPVFLPAYLDAASQKAYMGIGGFLFWVDFAARTMSGTQLNDYMVQSIDGAEAGIFVASSYMEADGSLASLFSINALANDGASLWEASGTYRIDVAGARYDTTAIDGLPKIAAIANMDGPAVVVTAGESARLFRASNGADLYSGEFPNAVVGIGISFLDDGHDMFPVATADGALDIWMPSIQAPMGTTSLTRLPFAIDDATIEWYEGRSLLALLKSAQPAKEMLVYRLDNRSPSEAIEVSLDKLIDEARAILALNEGNDGPRAAVNAPESYWL